MLAGQCTAANVAAATPNLYVAILGSASPTVALIAANLFVVAFGMSWGPVVWVLLGELFPNRIRAAALSLAGAAQWLAIWAITVSFPALSDFSLGVAYGLYAAGTFAGGTLALNSYAYDEAGDSDYHITSSDSQSVFE